MTFSGPAPEPEATTAPVPLSALHSMELGVVRQVRAGASGLTDGVVPVLSVCSPVVPL